MKKKKAAMLLCSLIIATSIVPMNANIVKANVVYESVVENQEKAKLTAYAIPNGGDFVDEEAITVYESGIKLLEYVIVNQGREYIIRVTPDGEEVFSYSYTLINPVRATRIRNDVIESTAEKIALDKTLGGEVIRLKTTYDDGLKIFKVKVVRNNIKHSFGIDGNNAQILSYKQEPVDIFINIDLPSEFKITAKEATRNALKISGSGELIQCKADVENGQPVFDIEIETNYYRYEFEIDGSNGNVINYTRSYLHY